jgi:hypothetical protein
MRFRVLKNKKNAQLAQYHTADKASETTNKVTQEATYNFRVEELEKEGFASDEFFLPSSYWFSSTANLKKYLGAVPYNSNTRKSLANGLYFKELGDVFENPNLSANPEALAELQTSIQNEMRYKNFFIEEDVFKEAENLHQSFPVFNTIRLQTLPYQLTLAKSLKEEKLLEKFCKAYIARQLKSTEMKFPETFHIDSYDLGSSGEVPASFKPLKIEYLATKEVVTPSAADIVKNQEQNFDNFTVLTDDVAKEHTKFSMNSAMKLITVLNKFAQDDQLDVFMFEIRKHKIADGEEDTFFKRLDEKKLLQKFFIPAFSDDINFVDTQVRQGINYYYQVIAHCFLKEENKAIILGLPWDNTIDNFADPAWKLISKGSVKILTPRNKSPLSPEMDIFPLERSDQFVRILVKNRYGQEVSKPVLIDTEDAGRFSPKVLDDKKDMRFATDETVGEFEIFRIEAPPENYKSFSPTDETRVARLQGSGVLEFVDAIEPNRDYYYCVRVIDPHGNISNPTNVIKLRIVSVDDSLPYFTKKNYDFSEFPKIYEKTFQKYLLIRPSEFQSTLLEGPDGPRFAGDLFGKRLVLEIESTKTGRKIDFVVKFNPPIRKPPVSSGVKPPKKKEPIDPGRIKIGELPKTSPTIKEEISIKDKFPVKPSLVDDQAGNFKDEKIDPFKVQPKK